MFDVWLWHDQTLKLCILWNSSLPQRALGADLTTEPMEQLEPVEDEGFDPRPSLNSTTGSAKWRTEQGRSVQLCSVRQGCSHWWLFAPAGFNFRVITSKRSYTGNSHSIYLNLGLLCPEFFPLETPCL